MDRDKVLEALAALNVPLVMDPRVLSEEQWEEWIDSLCVPRELLQDILDSLDEEPQAQ